MISDVMLDCLINYFTHIKREANKVMHNLARYSICIFEFSMWMETVLPSFVSLVLANMTDFS